MLNKVHTTSMYSSWDRCQGVFPANVFPYITSQLETVSRVDIVRDRYLTHSLKQSTRDRITHSGTTQRQRVIAGVPIPANWEAFLRSNANKDELFRYLSNCIQACKTGRNVIICTKEETIGST